MAEDVRAEAREILPIGSVVRLAGAEALVVVMGFEPELDEGRADYLGVPWPMGLVADDAALAFDGGAVSEVVWRGLWDDEAEAGISAVRRFRAATLFAERSMRELIDSLTLEHFEELRERYTVDALAEEPEPEFLEEAKEAVTPDEPEAEMPEPEGEGADDALDALDELFGADEGEPDFLDDEEELA